jgi:hypothetical protein
MATLTTSNDWLQTENSAWATHGGSARQNETVKTRPVQEMPIEKTLDL